MPSPEEARALEERLAREVMGWEVKEDGRVEGCWPRSLEIGGRYKTYPRWHPLTSPYDALELLEATAPEQAWKIALAQNGTYLIRDWNHDAWIINIEVRAPTLPEAICRAVEAWLDAKEAK